MSAPDAKKQRLDMDALEADMADIQKYQDQLEELNEKASEEILKVEQKFNKQRTPLFTNRQAAIEKLDKSKNDKELFWARALANHPFLAPMMSTPEVQIMASLAKLEVIEDEDIKSGFVLRFTFNTNEYFKNETIEKKYHISQEGEVENSTTKIQWKQGKNIMEDAETETEFLSWLTEESEETNDDVADLIKDDLWQNPYQYYLGLAESDDDEAIEEETEE